MPILVNLDVMMAKRKISLGELDGMMGITGKGDKVLHTLQYMPDFKMPTGRHIGI